MKKLIFYHQKRRDGGVRTGVEINDERVLEKFKRGHEPEDSRLLWYVDLRSVGRKVPTQPEAVRKWLLQNSVEVRNALREMEEDLRTGIDSDWPVKKDLPVSQGPKSAIYCSAMRRTTGREIANVISKLEKNWEKIIGALPTNESLERRN